MDIAQISDLLGVAVPLATVITFFFMLRSSMKALEDSARRQDAVLELLIKQMKILTEQNSHLTHTLESIRDTIIEHDRRESHDHATMIAKLEAKL